MLQGDVRGRYREQNRVPKAAGIRLYGLVWNGKGSSDEFFFLSVFRNQVG